MPIDIGGTPLPTSGSFLGGYGGLGRMSRRLYDPERAWRNISPQRQGSISGGLTYDHVYDLTYNPLKYTVLSPSHDLSSPILNDKGPRPRIGSFTLDMIDWNSNLAQLTGSTIGLTQPLVGTGSVAAQGQELPAILRDPMTFLSDKDIDVFANAPARLLDYAFSWNVDLGLKAMGISTAGGADDEGAHQYIFQQQGTYWAWLRGSTEEQRRQMAEYQADRSIDRSRNAYLRDELLKTFEGDFDRFDNLSSGNSRFDYIAKSILAGRMRQPPTAALAGETAAQTYGRVRERIQQADASQDMAGFQLGHLLASSMPLIGTEVAQHIVPIRPETEQAWRNLSPAERADYLQQAGITSALGDIIATLPLFVGVGAVAGIARAGAFGTIAARLGASARTVEMLGRTGTLGKAGMSAARFYDRTLVVSNSLMAVGLTTATANWAASAASPEYSKTIGRMIDGSRLVSHSSLAGVVNATGFLTGFYGVETALPLWYRTAGKAANLIGKPIGGFEHGLPDLSFHRELGGSRLTGILEKDYGLSREAQGTAMTAEFLSIAINRRMRQLTNDYLLVARGGRTGKSEIDDLPSLADRMAVTEGLIAQEIKNVQGTLAMTLPRALNTRSMEAGLWAGPKGRRATARRLRIAQAEVDEVTQTMLGRYGERFHPSHLPTLRANSQIYLRGLGLSDDLTGLIRFAGNDMSRWKQVNRNLYQQLFHRRNVELHAAAEGSTEADHIGMVSSRHLFADEIEGHIETLNDSTNPVRGQALYDELIATKDDVQDLEAQGAFNTPEGLARTLAQIAPIMPARRLLGATSAGGGLNDFQKVLEREGLWTIAFKPTGTWTLPEGWVRGDVPAPGGRRLAYSPDQLRDMGYRPMQASEVMPGPEFSRRDPIWPVPEYGGGVWLREMAGERIHTTAAPPPKAGATVKAAQWNYANAPANGDRSLTFLGEERWSDIDEVYGLNPTFLNFVDTGERFHGGNAKADWPILSDDDGNLWMFKARRGEGGMTDLNPARQLSAPTVGKLLAYLGLPQAREIPLTWNGVKGTVQPVIQDARRLPLDPARLSQYVDPYSPDAIPDALPTMQQHMVVDWLTSQHDTNNGSFLMGRSGTVAGIDKGQAWLDFGQLREKTAFDDPTGEGFWTYRGSMALEKHLGEYLLDWRTQSGYNLDRGNVETVIQQIEAIPDDVFRDWLWPLARARVATGRFETYESEFIEAMVERKHNLRAAVNRGYDYIEGIAIAPPGEVQSFKPGQHGTYRIDLDSARVNDLPVPWESKDFDEPDVPLDLTRVGVVVEEADGRLWMVEPRDHFAGHMGTFPKGHAEMAQLANLPMGYDTRQFMRSEAAREVSEETGLSISLTSHLIDQEVEPGKVIRYYVARRTGGGPQYAQAKETWSVKLGTPDQIALLLNDIDSAGMPVGSAIQREVLEAYMALRHPPAAQRLAAEAGPDVTMPGDHPADEEFLSYVKLPGDIVFRSPWLEYPLAVPELIEMGNRSVAMAKFDDVFRGWRTYRLEQGQRAALHRRLTGLDVGLTPARIDLLHEAMQDIASEAKVPPQAAVLAQPWMPFANIASAKVDDAIEKILGKGPFLHADGTIAPVDFRRELARAYSTSVKLNMTAGLTSQLYSIGAMGAGASFLSHVIYPSFRFALSPLFKVSELIESWGLNAMRGVNPFAGDPFTEGLMLQAGVAHQRGQIRAELQAEPMLQGMTIFSLVDDATPTSKTLMFRSPQPEGVPIRRRKQMEAGEKPAELEEPMRGLRPDPSFADIYPDRYPDLGIDVIVPRGGVDETGAPILDFEGRTNDDAQLGRSYDSWLHNQLADAVTSDDLEASLHDFLAGSAFVDSLGDDFIPRLVRAMTPLTTSSSRTGDALANLRRNLEEGVLPLAGAPGRGREHVEGVPLEGEAAAPVLQDTARMPNTSPDEMMMGHVDAYYAGLGSWEYGQTGTSVTFMLRDSVWKKAVIFDNDRIGYFRSGPSSFYGNMLTPSGAYRLIAQKVYQSLHGARGEDLAEQIAQGGHFAAADPVELAIPGGSSWDEIEAIILQADQIQGWADLVRTYGDAVPALRDIKVVALGAGSTDIKKAASEYWFEKAGLLDRRFADPTAFRDQPIGSFTHLLPSTALTPDLARKVINNMTSQVSPLRAMTGVSDRALGGAQLGVAFNLDDMAASGIVAAREEAKRIRADYESSILKGRQHWTQPGPAKDRLDKAEADIEVMVALRRDIADWRQSAKGRVFRSLDEAKAALGTGADIAAHSWIAAFSELDARLRASNIFQTKYSRSAFEGGLGAAAGELARSQAASHVHDVLRGDKMELPAWDRVDDTLHTYSAYGDVGDTQAIALASQYLERWKAVRVKGFAATPGFEGLAFDNIVDQNRLSEYLAPLAFVDELRRAAYAKTGHPQGQPIVHAWLRTGKGWSDTRVNGEVVITVIGPDGQPYGGLGFDEMEDIWKRTALPAAQQSLGPSMAAHEVMGSHQLKAIWTPDGGSAGSLVFYDKTLPGVDRHMVDLPDGTTKFSDPDLPPERYVPVRFLYSFEPRPDDTAFVNLAARNTYENVYFKRRDADIVESRTFDPFSHSPINVYSRPSTRNANITDWHYMRDNNAYTVSGTTTGRIAELVLPARASRGQAPARDLVDHLLNDTDRHAPARVRIAADNEAVLRELAHRRASGELPADWVFVKAGADWPGSTGRGYLEAMTDDDWQRVFAVPEEVIAMMPEPPPTSLADVPGSPEHLTRRIGDRLRAQSRAAYEAWWNPIPTKELQQDRLIGRLVREWYPDELRELVPHAYSVMAKELGVPDREMLSFLVRDRQLLERWHTTGARADFDALVLHAEQWRPVSAKGKARDELDTLYSKPEWTDMMEILRLTSKAASDESFQVHFFAPYRSTFERSINHPLLGVYPASWAYKVAKEWWRFLFDNDMLYGFRLGMTPAVWIAQMREQQHVAFAQMTDQDLDKWMREGPLSSSIFLFNLLMPGDWSALPFPLSRSIRDALRGNLDPYSHFQNNVSAMGLGRDIRLTGELGAEWKALLLDEVKPMRRGEAPFDTESVLPR